MMEINRRPAECFPLMVGRSRRCAAALAMMLGWGLGGALAQDVGVREFSSQAQPTPAAPSDSPVADYFSSRVSDLGDTLNFRLRGGLGLSAHARATKHLDLFAGSHNLWNLGIPGYDANTGWGGWVDRETENGLIFFGVDATDDTEYEFEYADPEFDLGLHLLLLGAEFGIDPVEIGDFIVGIFGIDPAGDDIGSTNPPDPPAALHPDKSAQFDGLGPRLEYVRETFNQDLDRHVNTVDTMFADGNAPPVRDRPSAQFRLGLYAEFEDGSSSGLSLDTDFRLDVKLPNLEHRWDLFITREAVGELPDTSPTDRDNDASRIGLARIMDDYPISFDAGVRLTLPLEAFAGVQWREAIVRDDWTLLPQVRFFYETDEGFGNLTTFGARRWLGQNQGGLFRTTSAMRISESTDGAELEQSLGFGYIGELLNPDRRGQSIGVDDVAHGVGVVGSVRGNVDSDRSVMDRYRVSFPYRRPLYQNWIFLVIEPQLEWENDNEWDLVTILRIGADLIFWRY